MKINFISCLTFSFLFWLANCTNDRNNKEQIFREVLSGGYAKLWMFKTQDSLDCHCYYEVIYKSGKMNHVRRDKQTGEFVSYFNDLSGDVLNNNKFWNIKNDTLNLMGFDYKVVNISKGQDTISLEKITAFQPSRKYYLIDSRLMDASLAE